MSREGNSQEGHRMLWTVGMWVPLHSLHWKEETVTAHKIEIILVVAVIMEGVRAGMIPFTPSLYPSTYSLYPSYTNST